MTKSTYVKYAQLVSNLLMVYRTMRRMRRVVPSGLFRYSWIFNANAWRRWFVCQVCSDNLIYDNLDNNNLAQHSSKQDIMISSNELAVDEVLGVTPQDTININNYQRSLNSHSSDINSQLSSSQVDKSDEINDISTKNKPKRVTKSNKIKERGHPR